MDVKQVLYITYDGLTDPLGQSQILPYLAGLSRHGYRFTILSFEKPDRFRKEKRIIDQLTVQSSIEWVPLPFTSKPPLLSKFYDALRMRRKAEELHRQKKFDMVHCRSYIAANVGLYLKKKFGTKFFFDMRGFWADEKKDGSWNMANPVFNRVYKYYKRKEAEYLQHADYIIVLTQAGKKEMNTWSVFNPSVPVEVIPCCADMEHFSLTSQEQKRQSREKLGIAPDCLVLSYLGSIGTWYMLDEMLIFFKKVKAFYPAAKFLLVTHSPGEVIVQRMAEMNLEKEDFIITQAARKEVPSLLKASDLNISFIRPVYSKISSSPTKLGEVLAMGIPVIVNSGVGDVKEIVDQAEAGYVLNGFSDQEYEGAIHTIPILLKKSPADIRQATKQLYSLENGIQSYLACYRCVLS